MFQKEKKVVDSRDLEDIQIVVFSGKGALFSEGPAPGGDQGLTKLC